ncbi:MAG: integrase [Arcobacter sp.]|nr:MAG: integrase [Arcobacter sp.]
MRKVQPLTDTKIKTAKTQEKNYTLSDGHGLQLLVKTNKVKLWEFYYKSPTLHKRRKTSFGSYPTQTTLINARKKRALYLDLISKGIDPIDYYRKEKEKILVDVNGNFKSVMYEWLEKESKSTKAITHKGKVRVFENDVLPFLRKKHIKDVDIDDIIKIIDLKKISAPEIASRLFNNMDNLFRYAVLKRYCDRNLLADIRKSDIIKARTAKHMPKITEPKILSELISLIYEYKGGYSLRNCLKLVLHLPLRAENLCNLKWKYIDFNNKILTIPRQEMKLKNINLDDFVLPLTEEVIKILKEQETIQTKYTHLQEFVFLGRDNNKAINKESPNRVLERLGFNDEARGRKIRLHGFRGTFRSMIDTLDIENKFSFDVKERALDHHEKNEVARAYNHKANYIEQLKSLMCYWSDYIMELKS